MSLGVDDFTPVEEGQRLVKLLEAGPGSDLGLGHSGPGWPGDWWHVVDGKGAVICTCNTQEKAGLVEAAINASYGGWLEYKRRA